MLTNQNRMEFSTELLKSYSSQHSTRVATTLNNLYSQIQTVEEEENEDQLNGLLDFVTKPTLKKDKILQSFDPIKKKGEEDVRMGLVTQLDIRSDQRWTVGILWKSLTVYYFQKPTKSLFGESGQTTQKNMYYTTVALMDAYQKFNSERNHRAIFYIISKNETILFNSYAEQKFILIHTKQREMIFNIERAGIFQHTMLIEGTDDYATLIRGKNIKVFYNWYLNQILTGNLPFQLISNFRFNCCQERFPMQVYNGKQKTAKQKPYHLKVQGYFFKQNIQRLYAFSEKQEMIVSCKTYSITSKFSKIIEKGFEYQDSDEQNQQMSSCMEEQSQPQ